MPPPQKKSLSRLGLVIFTIVSLALGAYYRFPSLGDRPMHTDEAILAMKSAEFQVTGHFQYDPKDFHGPGLHYITRLWSRLAGWGDSSTWTEAQLRTVPVVCGLLLLLATLLLRNALGFAMREALTHLKTDGNTAAMKTRSLSAQEYNDCLGLPEVEAWENRFSANFE